MEIFEFDCYDIVAQAEKCYEKVCQEIKDNPAFNDIMRLVLISVCSSVKNNPPKHLKIEVSDDKKELVVSNYRKDEELHGGLMNYCVTYSRAVLKMAPDGNIHIITSNNRAFPLEEYESKYSGLRIDKERIPLTSSEYPAVYRVHSSFHAYNKLGIEMSYSEYKDFCPRSNTNFDDFIEESMNHCPQEWHLYDYPSDIREGSQEYYPYRAYFCRYLGRYGIMCSHEKRYTKKGFDEVVSKYVCDENYPNQLLELTKSFSTADVIPFIRTVNGEVTIKPEDYITIPGLDEETLEFRLNSDFIEKVQKNFKVNPILRNNSIKLAQQGLTYVDELPEKIGQYKNDNEPNPMKL